MKVVTMVQENAEDIYEAAKNVNEERAAKKEAAEFEDAEETEEAADSEDSEDSMDSIDWTVKVFFDKLEKK